MNMKTLSVKETMQNFAIQQALSYILKGARKKTSRN